ncbi:tetratricopeptide repeat protein [Sphingomonas jaspsi]|uniref:tetratricopeptide repeat protein n=1 Tax=Sphingomonas jaspsi TaxID=392409 RepID=UPI0004B384C2|nr:tetratricopeptide repeat protein [Sphingomonas jaspsi]
MAIALAASAAFPAGAAARQPVGTSSDLLTYVQARTAEMEGDGAKSARLYASILKSDPGNVMLARRAMAIALQAGDTPLALSLAKRIPTEQLGFDGRTLLAVDLLKARKYADALAMLKKAPTSTETDLLAPLVEAWADTMAGNGDGVARMAALPADSMLKPVATLQRAHMLIALGKRNEAVAAAKAAVVGKPAGFTRQRIELAAGLQRLGEREAALSILAGDDGPLVRARQAIEAGKALPTALDTPAKAMGELLMSLASDLARGEADQELSLALARIAAYADPDNNSATILSALFLDGGGVTDGALNTLRSIPPNDLFAGDALDLEARILSRNGRDAEALQRVEALANAADAPVVDITRLADVLGELDRHAEAAKVYGRAIDAATAEGAQSSLWSLYLLRASSLEEVDRWADAKADLKQALALEPENPILLNFLGYGKLERGEDLDAAEAMIRKASAMRPDDASITDSLGWALYKRGNLPEAIDTLRRAAAGDPAQSDIHEHLGDALFKAGRRIEARFSWTAALVTAPDKVKDRLQSKLDNGLNPANAAP